MFLKSTQMREKASKSPSEGFALCESSNVRINHLYKSIFCCKKFLELLTFADHIKKNPL